jgi:acyl carrier protein
MDRQAIFAELTDIFRDVFQDDDIEVGESTTAADIMMWDSLSNIQMVIAVERAFKIRLTAAQVSGLKDVGGFVDVITVKLKAKG